MKYLKLISLLFVAMLGSLFVSCEETAEVDEYANWQERNEEFIRDIAQKAKSNEDGKWERILSFKLNATDAQGNPVEHGVDDYVYCHKVTDGEGTEHPNYTDFVSVNYRGPSSPPTANLRAWSSMSHARVTSTPTPIPHATFT